MSGLQDGSSRPALNVRRYARIDMLHRKGLEARRRIVASRKQERVLRREQVRRQELHIPLYPCLLHICELAPRRDVRRAQMPVHGDRVPLRLSPVLLHVPIQAALVERRVPCDYQGRPGHGTRRADVGERGYTGTELRAKLLGVTTRRLLWDSFVRAGELRKR